jgi:Na+-transporting methylmalonyl-CoA/oxaloacetate decarboxylase gamma subunit
MKRYIIVGVAFIIIFLMIVIYGVNYIRKESDQSMAELQTLKA